MVAELPPQLRHRSAGLNNAIVTTLGGIPTFHKASVILSAPTPSAAEENERGKSVVVVVNEAHLLAADQLELRLLADADMDSHSPFACCSSANPGSAAESNCAPSPPSTSASPCASQCRA